MKTSEEMIEITINSKELKFQTDPVLFSPKAIDKGTFAMLSVVVFRPGDKVLDLGCGYGVVGVFAATTIGQENVIMCDISSQAVLCARENAILNGVPKINVLESNGFAQITDRDFTLILSNPPYHADFSVPKHFIEEGYKRLKFGGRLVMVTKRLEWYKRKFISVFGGVQIFRVDGYYVFVGEKRRKIGRDDEKRELSF